MCRRRRRRRHTARRAIRTRRRPLELGLEPEPRTTRSRRPCFGGCGNTVAPSSRKSYISSMGRYLFWLFRNKPHRLTEQFRAGLAADCPDGPLKARAALFLRSSTTPPIQFAELEASDFLEWIITLRKPNGDTPGTSTYNTHRTALTYIFVYYGAQQGDRFKLEVATHYRGLKRQVAAQLAQGGGRVQTGKDPMSFALFRVINEKMLQAPGTEYVYARMFQLICWHLMCRASNAISILLCHFEWREDALGVYFAHMKNDQNGERPRDARHIYANPLSPEVCPILALGR
jgi:hypothetical protein